MKSNSVIKNLIREFFPYAKKKLAISEPVKLFLRADEKNAEEPLGKTAFYDPENKSITVYISKRHPKDVLRSVSHELVHHCQNCRGEFDKLGCVGEGYAQENEHLRKMEEEAYLEGCMLLRDWEDSRRNRK